MTAETLAEALECEHQEIDAGIEEFLANRARGGDQAAPLRRALGALRRHIYLEEEFLFPPLDEAGLVAPIFVMLREHGEIWLTMDEIEAELAQHADAGPSEESCRELLTQLERHNSKEEAIVYPQADATLGREADAELRALLADGPLPAGWRCQNVRA